MRRLLLTALLAAGMAHAQPTGPSFRFAFQGDVQSLDPATMNETFTLALLAHVYEPLVSRAPDLSLEPGLAERWERLSDTRWRFHLRRNARFQDGTPFTAEDAVFSIHRTGARTSALLARVVSIRTATAVDAHTLDLETDGPDPTLLANLTNVLILPRTWAEERGAAEPVPVAGGRANPLATVANGTGPFRITERAPAERIVFTRNPAWWGRMTGNVAQATFLPIASDATRVAALLSGQVDLAWPIPVQDAPRVARTAGLRMIEELELRTVFLGMDQQRPELLHADVRGRNPLADIRVREAIYRAIDIAAIRDRIMRGRAAPTALLNGPGIEGFDAAVNASRPVHDRARARALLAEAGYPEGFGLGMHCPNNRYVNDAEICQAVAAMLAQVGIRVALTAEPAVQFFARAGRRDVSFYMLGTTPPTYDSFSTMFGLAMCREEQAAALGRTPLRGQGQFNHGGYCNPTFDDAVLAARTELDPARRRAHFAQAWRVMVQDFAYIPLHQQYVSWGVRDSVELVARPDDVLDMRTVTVR
jgi:peptide/nickel transport system substrate-binding protein